MVFEEKALTEHIGSQISLDRSRLNDPTLGKALRERLVERGVLWFREFHARPEEQVALAQSLGRLREEGENGIFKITLSKSARTSADYLKGSFLWHMDGTHDDTPIFASLLTGIQLSDEGGQTEFANAYAAYEALTQDMKDRIADLRVVHSVETSMRRAGVDPTPENLAVWRRIPDRTHRLVWTHRVGRKSLVIGCHAKSVVGMDAIASERLLEELLSWTTQSRFVYRHEWRLGDMLIWDNTGVLHRAEPYPENSGRLMHRTTLLGEESFA